MMKNLRWRLLLIAAVIGLSIWSFYPPDQKVKLGLDLKGGVHLVLQVNRNDPLRAETNLTVERLRESLDTASIRYTKIEATSPTEFRVEGIQDDAVFRDKATEVAASTYTRSSGAGGTYTFTMLPNIAISVDSPAGVSPSSAVARARWSPRRCCTNPARRWR